MGPATPSLTASKPSSDSISGSCANSLSGVWGTRGSSRSTCHSSRMGSSSKGLGSPFHNEGTFLFWGTPFTHANGSKRMTPIIAYISGEALTARRGTEFGRRDCESEEPRPERSLLLVVPENDTSSGEGGRMGDSIDSSVYVSSMNWQLASSGSALI
jgi:hypothetical protein